MPLYLYIVIKNKHAEPGSKISPQGSGKYYESNSRVFVGNR